MEHELIWKKEYEVGDYEIDAEHQIFLKIIFKINKEFEDDFDNEYEVLLLNELYKYADFHFTSEENRMRLFKYPDYESHKKEHKKLLIELSEKISFFNLKFIEKNKLVEFLYYWFINHTSDLDLKFGIYLNKNK